MGDGSSQGKIQYRKVIIPFEFSSPKRLFPFAPGAKRAHREAPSFQTRLLMRRVITRYLDKAVVLAHASNFLKRLIRKVIGKIVNRVLGKDEVKEVVVSSAQVVGTFAETAIPDFFRHLGDRVFANVDPVDSADAEFVELIQQETLGAANIEYA